MWKRWGTSQNFFLAFLDELEKQIFTKKIVEKKTNLNYLKSKEKQMDISLSKSQLYDPQFLRYRAKLTEIGNFRSFFVILPS